MKMLFLLSSVVLFCNVFGQTTIRNVGKKEADADSLYYSKVKYRLLGPWRGGRSAAVAGSYKDRNTFYFGATGGGVWKTSDGGSNWKNISDKYFGGTIGAVAVAPSDESVIYVGEGENTMRGNVAEGFGIWRSDDGGRNWKNMGLRDTRHITRIIIHPRNPDIVWVAASGHLFGPNDERGVYKTINGGKTWQRVLFANKQAGAIDLVMEPGNPQNLYASTWRVIRTPYSLESGGEGSALWKSTDGGTTWMNLMDKKGMPKKEPIGIIGVTVSPANPDRVWAIIEAKSGGLFRSDDGGETWSRQSDDANIRQRAWYYNKIFADPKNENVVYALNVGFYRSRDGGKTFQSIPTPHSDHHDLWIDPQDPNRMIVADDGGAQVSFDAGGNWSTLNNQPTAQLYRVTTDNHFPYRVLAAQQDNSTLRILSRTNGAAITDRDWEPTAGAESGYVVADPLNPDIVYGGNYGGYLSRLDHKTGENRAVSVWPDNPMGAGADVLKYRFQWNFPVFFSPHNPKKLYAGGNHLFATENEGQQWTEISHDLTTNDKTKQVSSGGPITKDNTSVEYYCTIFTATESSLEKDLLWTGSDDGLIHVSRNAGKDWQNVTPPAAGKWMMWNCVETDPFTKGGAYFVGTRYKSDDFAPYIFRTSDYGKTWKKITTGIPSIHFTRALRADKKVPGLLYCGTEYGMYISYDNGDNWKPFQLNLPVVSITDLTIKENDLVVGTQGRSIYILDDLSLVQQKNGWRPTTNLHVFKVNDAYRTEGSQNLTIRNAGMNPPNGVVFNYYLRNAADSSNVSITIYDKKGKEIKTFSRNAKENTDKLEFENGMNRFVWNMMYPAPERIEGMILWNGSPSAAKAAPGNYKARFRFGKDSVETAFLIKPDPNYKMTEADYDEQVSFLLNVSEKFSEIQKAIKDIRLVRSQLADFTGRLDTANSRELKKLADTIQKKVTRVEEALYQTNAKSGQDVLNFPIRLNDKISGVFDYANSGYNVPGKQAREAFQFLSAQADRHLAELKAVLGNEVVQFNKLVHEKQVPVIGVKR
ncbi:glycosyl hydrolase [Segetibacter sp. 3557_3]|uniref:WD40/YVTN/BNR-like repeat-containing protein n=1 Tax=Segetibacter sp. 3557_3 TaxID=2547429 RepID=UPI001058A7C3|nr:glycosyl hydrolase [Segetibacter sp. 3557_3]TDH25549.1 glycosyl hydrolase [Segetibacter sp. 3557_3]